MSDQCDIIINASPNTFNPPIQHTAASSLSARLSAASTEYVTVSAPGVYVYGNISVQVSQKWFPNPPLPPTLGDACAVRLKGNSITAFRQGSTVQGYRKSDLSSSPDITFELDGGSLRFTNYSNPNFSQLIYKTVTPLQSPATGYFIPWAVEVQLESPASFDKLTITTSLDPNLTPEDRARTSMIAYHSNGTTTDITAWRTETQISGETTSLSTFAVIMPLDIYDKSGPIVNVQTERGFEIDGKMYISTISPVDLHAEDMTSMSLALAGVASTYYLIDKTPAGCQSIPYDPAAPPGTCANRIYAGPFVLPEGIHHIYTHAVDKISNYGEEKYTELHVDGTPQTQMTVRCSLADRRRPGLKQSLKTGLEDARFVC